MSDLSTILVAVVTALLGGGAFWIYRNRQKSKLGKLRDQNAVLRATKRVEQLRAARKELEGRVDEKDTAIRQIDDQLKENKRQIANAHDGGEELTDAEVDEELRRLGIL